MLINMRTMRGVILLAGSLVIAACAAGSARSPEISETGFLHHYALEPGDVFRFESEATTAVEIDMPEMPIEQPMEITIPSTIRFEVDEKSGGKVTGKMVIEKFSLEGLGGIMGMMGDMPGMDIEGKEIAVSMDERGKVETRMDLEGMGLGGGIVSIPGDLGGFFIPWPEHGLEPGESWSDTTKYEQNIQGMDISMQFINTYTYLGLKMEEGVEDAPMAHAVHGTLKTMLGLSGEQEGMGISMSGSGTGEGDYFFGSSDGILLSATITMQQSMLMEIFGAMDMSMPMDVRSTTVSRRIR